MLTLDFDATPIWNRCRKGMAFITIVDNFCGKNCKIGIEPHAFTMLAMQKEVSSVETWHPGEQCRWASTKVYKEVT